jgi:hypothetical protein
MKKKAASGRNSISTPQLEDPRDSALSRNGDPGDKKTFPALGEARTGNRKADLRTF